MSTSGKRGRSLTAALSKVAGSVAPEVNPPSPEPAPEQPTRRPVVVQLYVAAEDHDRLRDLSYHSRTSLQQLGMEAWNLLLASRGHAPLTPTTNSRPSGRQPK